MRWFALVLWLCSSGGCNGSDERSELIVQTSSKRVSMLSARDNFLELVNDAVGATVDGQVAEATKFLVQYMPKRDMEILSPEYVAENVRVAFAARKEFWQLWGKDTPWFVFLNDVLPYASLMEPRDKWRVQFNHFMRKQVKGCTDALCAAVALNRKAWSIVNPPIQFVAAPADELNSYGPFQTMERHNSSCTGLSIFLVDSLRSIGIPARVAGVPHWKKGKQVCPRGDADAECGNHNWVEVFANHSWHFIDQRGEFDTLDRGWFFPENTNLQKLGTLNNSIYATSWAPSHIMKSLDPLAYKDFIPVNRFPMVWDWQNQNIPAWEVVNWYHKLAHDQ